jgi:hypothetical protein
MDYGVNSIIIIKLIRELEKYFQIKINGREIFEFRTIKSLSGYLHQKIESQSSQDNISNEKNTNIIAENIEYNKYSNEQISDVLDKFKQGILTLEEIESIV